MSGDKEAAGPAQEENLSQEWPSTTGDIWLKPRRTLQLLDRCREKIARLEGEVEAERQLRESLERRETTLLDRLAEKETGLTLYMERTDRLENELAEARVELADRKSTEEQILEFDGWVRRVEQLKEKYENRIAGLKAHILELQERLDMHAATELTEIDMRGSIPGEPEDSEDDWLDPLPIR